ncbi:hypothetical protein TeGR_g14282 [Tetraparma gracilis]|uniref:Uncharacterized protein n=1 Tax=Tetraparma gracilis TaxID=2962635 RepID=A0ABQ6M9U5_9STRA|nr:hypothetical protein TeGR_g14282 [Tetraparma gracilis]
MCLAAVQALCEATREALPSLRARVIAKAQALLVRHLAALGGGEDDMDAGAAAVPAHAADAAVATLTLLLHPCGAGPGSAGPIYAAFVEPLEADIGRVRDGGLRERLRQVCRTATERMQMEEGGGGVKDLFI